MQLIIQLASETETRVYEVQNIRWQDNMIYLTVDEEEIPINPKDIVSVNPL